MKKFFSKPWLIIGILLLGTLFFVFQLTKIEIDNNNYRFIPKKNESRLITEYIDEHFGTSITVLIGLEQKFDSVFEPQFLNALKQFDTELLKLPLVDTVVSLVSTDYISGEDGAIVVESLVADTFTGSEQEIHTIKKRIASWDMYDKMLVSDDFGATQVVVAIDADNDKAGSPEVLAIFREIRSTADAIFDTNKTNVYITGIPVFSANINEAVIQDLIFLVPLVVFVVLLTLFFSFKRFFAVLIPILTVVISAIWAIGAMPLFGIQMSILTTVLPVILVAVGSAYGIHVVSNYIDLRKKAEQEQKILTKEAHTELVYILIRRIGKPVFLAALTTFAGFIAFCFTSVIPIREFGIFASFGVLIAVAVSLSFIPALLIVRGPVPLKKQKQNDTSADPLSEAVTTSFLGLIKGKRKILILSTLIALVCAALIPNIIVDNVLVEYFRDETDMARSDTFVRNYFGGSKIVSLMVKAKPVAEGEQANKVLTPEVLAAMDGLGNFLETKIPEVGKVTSFTHLLKRINQVYNADESSDGIAHTGYSVVSSDFGFGNFDADNNDNEDSWNDFGFGNFDDAFAEPDFGFGGLDFETDSTYDASFSFESLETSPIIIKNLDDLIVYLDDAQLFYNKNKINGGELIEGLKKQINYEGASYYEIPIDPFKYGQVDAAGLEAVISNYMMLLSGDISGFADDPLEPTALKMNVQLKTTGQLDTDRAIRAMEDYVAVYFPNTVDVSIGGFALVEGAINKLVVQSQLISVIFSLLMVFLIIAFSYKSVLVGVIGIIPLAISILVDFGIMALFNIKLNIGTALIASVAVGIGVDYAIHFIEAYTREKRLYQEALDNMQQLAGDEMVGGELVGGAPDGLVGTPAENALPPRGYLQNAYASSGKAILINAASVGLGFGVLVFSRFVILSQFGVLLAFTMLSSSLAALLILPVLLDWVLPKVQKKEKFGGGI